MSPNTADVAIFGGGPAGAAAALTLLRGTDRRVVLFERTGYARPRIGESLSPGAWPLLQHLGLGHIVEDQRPAYGLRAAWGGSDLVARDFVFTPQSEGWSLDRRLFDERLVRAVEGAGGDVRIGERPIKVSRCEEGWAIHGSGGTTVARHLIDATGKPARIATRNGARRIYFDTLHGIAMLGTTTDQEAFTDLEAVHEGWWYSTRLPDERIVFVLLSDTDLIKHYRLNQAGPWRAALEATTHQARRLAKSTLDGTLRAFNAYTGTLDRAAGEGWTAAGDAAASTDPLAGRGIPQALESGIEAARVADAALNDGTKAGPQYAQSVRQSMSAFAAALHRYYRIECRWPDEPFWQRRHTVVKLNPHARLARGTAACVGGQPGFVSAAHREALLGLCETGTGMYAHELIRTFGAEVSDNVPHQRLVLSLQQMVEDGVLVETQPT